MSYALRSYLNIKHCRFMLLTLTLMVIHTSSWAQSHSFTLMSWNLQWLSLSPSPRGHISRNSDDYDALRQLFVTYLPDILAFQEVDSIAALYKVIPKQQYSLYFSERKSHPHDHFKKNNQFTGFAVKKSLIIDDTTDLPALSSPFHRYSQHSTIPYRHKLRYGSIITLNIESQPIKILNIHLKSGCFSPKQLTTPKLTMACKTLIHQFAIIKDWVNQQQKDRHAFIIVGDFNHRINRHHTQFLSRLTNTPKTLHWLSRKIKANCTVKYYKKNKKTPKYRTYTQLIDHLFSSANIKVYSGQQIQFEPSALKQFQLSDHCPLLFTLMTTNNNK